MGKFKTLKERKNKLLNTGYNYRGRILYYSMSELIFQNLNVIGFATYIEKQINHLIYSVKSIKKSTNYLVSKDDDNVN